MVKSNTQPDSVYAWFNPVKCRVTAVVLPESVTPGADRLPVQIRVDCVGVMPSKMLRFKTVIREKLTKSDAEIDEMLNYEFSQFSEIYLDVVNRDSKNSRCRELGDPETEPRIDSKIVDAAAEDFSNILKGVKEKCWTKVKSRIPVGIPSHLNADQTKVAYCIVKMQDLTYKMITEPENRNAYQDEFVKYSTQLKVLKNIVVENRIEKECVRNQGSFDANPRSLFKYAGWQIKEAADCDVFNDELSPEEKEARIVENNQELSK